MRITEGQLRRMVREELIREAPLDDIVAYDARRFGDGEEVPSIAHPRTRPTQKRYADGKYTDIARDLMRSAKDNWVIITPSDVRSSHVTVDSPRFKEWLEEKRREHPPGTIFAFVRSGPIPGDYSSPKWQVLHDLIGHTLEELWKRHPNFNRSNPDIRRELRRELHAVLPRRFKISPSSPSDALPDILTAILLGKLSRESAYAVGDRLSRKILGPEDDHPTEVSPDDRRAAEDAFEIMFHSTRATIDGMFETVEWWLDSAREHGFVELNPW